MRSVPSPRVPFRTAAQRNSSDRLCRQAIAWRFLASPGSNSRLTLFATAPRDGASIGVAKARCARMITICCCRAQRGTLAMDTVDHVLGELKAIRKFVERLPEIDERVRAMEDLLREQTRMLKEIKTFLKVQSGRGSPSITPRTTRRPRRYH
jgi:hypothetical protein